MTREELIDLGAASIETKGGIGPGFDEKLDAMMTGLAED